MMAMTTVFFILFSFKSESSEAGVRLHTNRSHYDLSVVTRIHVIDKYFLNPLSLRQLSFGKGEPYSGYRSDLTATWVYYLSLRQLKNMLPSEGIKALIFAEST